MMQQPATSSETGHVFFAREPILTRRQRVFGYRLRVGRRETGPRDPEDGHELSDASRLVRDVGLDMLTNGHPAFIPVTRRDLLDGTFHNLPPRDVVLEVGADIVADSEIQSSCTDLRALGYRLAIDGFTMTAPAADLAAMADYLKVDVSDPRPAETRARTVACFGRSGTALIASGVATLEQAEAASQDGFAAFQGFFFAQPVVLPNRQVSPSQITLLRLVRALYDPRLSLGDLEELVKHDAELCNRILRAVNSAAFARRQTVSSMREALLLLGLNMVRRWASVWALAGLSADGPAELMVTSTVRARLCELLAGSAGSDDAAGEGFLLGACSLLDAITGRPMAEVVAELPLGDVTRQALCGRPSASRDLLDCVIAYERGAWDECEVLARRAHVNPEVLPGAFLDALRWSRELEEPPAQQGRPS